MKTIGGIVRGREIYYIRAEDTVRDASRYMTERRVGAGAVLDGTRLSGILREAGKAGLAGNRGGALGGVSFGMNR